MTTDRKEQLILIQDCINRESKLSDWERGFIDSISHFMANGGGLTPLQAETLELIWENVT